MIDIWVSQPLKYQFARFYSIQFDFRVPFNEDLQVPIFIDGFYLQRLAIGLDQFIVGFDKENIYFHIPFDSRYTLSFIYNDSVLYGYAKMFPLYSLNLANYAPRFTLYSSSYTYTYGGDVKITRYSGVKLGDTAAEIYVLSGYDEDIDGLPNAFVNWMIYKLEKRGETEFGGVIFDAYYPVELIKFSSVKPIYSDDGAYLELTLKGV